MKTATISSITNNNKTGNTGARGWCPGCMKRLGTRKYVPLYKPHNICLQCIKCFSLALELDQPEESAEPTDTELLMSKVQRIQSPEELGDIAPGLEKHITSAESVVETTQTDPVIKIKKIIATINEAKEYTDRIGRVIRRGLIEIDKLGGHGVLGYSDDSSFLATEFPTYTVAYLKHMRSTGRIEEIIGVPVGTYSVDAIKPLQRFRILKPVGGNVKGVVSQKNVVNQAGVVQVLEAWAIAKSFSEKAEREKPNRQDIRNAIAQMISAGQAVKRYHDNPSWRERYLSLEAEKTKLQTEKVELQNYCSLLEQKISELQNQLTIAC